MAVMMPREKWSDERLDDLNKKVDDGFAATKAEMREGFTRVDADIRELRGEVKGLTGEMNTRFDKINERLDALNRNLITVAAAIIGFLAALIAALIGIAVF